MERGKRDGKSSSGAGGGDARNAGEVGLRVGVRPSASEHGKHALVRAEAEFHYEPAAGPQHTSRLHGQPLVELAAGGARKERHVGFEIAHFALKAVAIVE